jgi:hypothetical protein
MVSSSAGATSGGKATVLLQLTDAVDTAATGFLDLERNARQPTAIPDDGIGAWRVRQTS